MYLFITTKTITMNMFEIHTREGKAVPINDLDKEACNLWGTPLDKKSYASPYDEPEVHDKYMSGEYTYGKSRMTGKVALYASRENWFDKIGWKIAYHTMTSWQELRDDVLAVYRKHNIPDEDLKDDPRVWGWIQLIDLWESQGYVAVSLDGDYNVLAKGGIRTATQEETTVV